MRQTIWDEDDAEWLGLAHPPVFQRMIRESREWLASTGRGGLKADAFWKAMDRVRNRQTAPGHPRSWR